MALSWTSGWLAKFCMTSAGNRRAWGGICLSMWPAQPPFCREGTWDALGPHAHLAA